VREEAGRHPGGAWFLRRHVTQLLMEMKVQEMPPFLKEVIRNKKHQINKSKLLCTPAFCVTEW